MHPDHSIRGHRKKCLEKSNEATLMPRGEKFHKQHTEASSQTAMFTTDLQVKHLQQYTDNSVQKASHSWCYQNTAKMCQTISLSATGRAQRSHKSTHDPLIKYK